MTIIWGQLNNKLTPVIPNSFRLNLEKDLRPVINSNIYLLVLLFLRQRCVV